VGCVRDGSVLGWEMAKSLTAEVNLPVHRSTKLSQQSRGTQGGEE
jgi:hypothetical protein